MRLSGKRPSEGRGGARIFGPGVGRALQEHGCADGLLRGGGHQIFSRGGAAQRVGTLCVYDANPQESFSEEDCKKLLEFGDRVSSVLSSPLGPHLERSHSDGHHLQSVSERVQALMVRRQV